MKRSLIALTTLIVIFVIGVTADKFIGSTVTKPGAGGTIKRTHSVYSNDGPAIKFEGTLLTFSPLILCGYVISHQVATYRVEKVLSGKFEGSEILVNYPDCDGDFFKNTPAGSRVRVSVRLMRSSHGTEPTISYFAEAEPFRIEAK